MAQIRMRVEALAHLPEGPPFDERQFRLREVATGQFPQQLQWRDAAADFVAAGLDRSFDARAAWRAGSEPRDRVRTGRGDLAAAAAQAAAGRDRELDRRTRQTDRRQQHWLASSALSSTQTTTRAKTNSLRRNFAHQSGAAARLRGGNEGMGFEWPYNSRNALP
jgi:hypothetical protein